MSGEACPRCGAEIEESGAERIECPSCGAPLVRSPEAGWVVDRDRIDPVNE